MNTWLHLKTPLVTMLCIPLNDCPIIYIYDLLVDVTLESHYVSRILFYFIFYFFKAWIELCNYCVWLLCKNHLSKWTVISCCSSCTFIVGLMFIVCVLFAVSFNIPICFCCGIVIIIAWEHTSYSGWEMD
jgi:hypothetical protein